MWRILHVEDHEDSREMMKILLESSNPKLEVDSAVSGSEARRMISHRPYDLYIFDLVLQDMMGTELCRWLRGNGSSSPIVFYSGSAQGADKREAMVAGATEFLVKPNDISRIGPVIDRLLKQRSTSHRIPA